jgi:hypothetical protein
LCDEFPEMGVLAPPSIGGTAVVLSLEVDSVDVALDRALAGFTSESGSLPAAPRRAIL